MIYESNHLNEYFFEQYLQVKTPEKGIILVKDITVDKKFEGIFLNVRSVEDSSNGLLLTVGPLILNLKKITFDIKSSSVFYFFLNFPNNLSIENCRFLLRNNHNNSIIFSKFFITID